MLNKGVKYKTINIALICDEGYIVPTIVTVQSIIEHVNKDRKYDINIFTNGISKSSNDLFINMGAHKKNINIKVYEINSSIFEELSCLHASKDRTYLVATNTALIKFRLASLLPNYSRILYLDGDIIVRSDLCELFENDIDNVYAGVVRDLPQVLYDKPLIQLKNDNRQYFNSGVMLLNLDKIRGDNVEISLIETKKNLLNDTLMDQNVFNIVFENNVLQLPLKYNCCYTNMVRGKDQYRYKDINLMYNTNYKSLVDIDNDAEIIHYSSKMKPWLLWDTQLADEWLYYYYKSPLANIPIYRTGKGDRVTVATETAKKEIEKTKILYEEKKKKGNIIPIVFAANIKYAPYAAVAIQSIIEHRNENNYYDIYILHDDELLLSQKLKLIQIKGNNYCVTCIDVRKGISTGKLYSRAHYSLQMYYRLLIPEIFTQYSKVLYIDCDLVLTKDIAELYYTDIGDNILGAINNFVTNDMEKYLQTELHIEASKYINSGVLLINCHKFIKENVKRKCFNTLLEHNELLCPDQDIINIVCKDKIKYLDDKWNFQWQHQWMNNYGKGAILLPFYKARYNTAKIDPWIIHYTSGRKPWKKPDLNFADIFWQYARNTFFYEDIFYSNIQAFCEKKIEEIKSIDINTTLSQNELNKLLENSENHIIDLIKNELEEKNRRITALTEEVDFYKDSLLKTRASLSFKLGCFILFFPKKIREIFTKGEYK